LLASFKLNRSFEAPMLGFAALSTNLRTNLRRVKK